MVARRAYFYNHSRLRRRGRLLPQRSLLVTSYADLVEEVVHECHSGLLHPQGLSVGNQLRFITTRRTFLSDEADDLVILGGLVLALALWDQQPEQYPNHHVHER